jgi:hypothetical protein
MTKGGTQFAFVDGAATLADACAGGRAAGLEEGAGA